MEIPWYLIGFYASTVISFLGTFLAGYTLGALGANRKYLRVINQRHEIVSDDKKRKVVANFLAMPNVIKRFLDDIRVPTP